MPPKFPHPFEIRGQVGFAAGTATICPHTTGWYVAAIRLVGPSGTLREVVQGGDEFRRLSWAIDVQDGDRIEAVITDAVARRAA